MDASSALIDALLAAGTVAVLFYVAFLCLRRIVIWARRQSKRAYLIGAAWAPFMALGNVRDPDFRIVQEAKRLKNREEDDAGDPPEPEVEQAAEVATSISEKRGPAKRGKEHGNR